MRNRKNTQHESKPWLGDPDFRELCRQKNHLFRLKTKNPNDVSLKLEYRSLLRKVNTERDRLKRVHFQSRFNAASGNISKVWKIVNSIFSKKESIPYPSEFNSSAGLLTENSAISNEFCRFYTEVADKFKQPTVDSSFRKYLLRQEKSMFLRPCDREEVILLCNSSKSKKSCGPDGILSKVIKESIQIIAEHISNMINECFETGLFPSKLKEAKITPVYKKGDKKDIGNYRPISVLNFFSKLYEKAINVRLVSFLESQQLLSPTQFGFRKARSPWMAINSLLEQVYAAWDKKEFCLGFFVDVCKAFDAVDHQGCGFFHAAAEQM